MLKCTTPTRRRRTYCTWMLIIFTGTRCCRYKKQNIFYKSIPNNVDIKIKLISYQIAAPESSNKLIMIVFLKNQCFQALPISGFRSMSSLPTLDDILSHDEDGTRGFAIEIDCHIPEHLHDKFRDLPIFPEKIKINERVIH